jgi:hypothetical protein
MWIDMDDSIPERADVKTKPAGIFRPGSPGLSGCEARRVVVPASFWQRGMPAIPDRCLYNLKTSPIKMMHFI